MDKIKVIVSVEDGCVVGVVCPNDVELEIRDYNVEDVDEERLRFDEYGNEYIIIDWE